MPSAIVPDFAAREHGVFRPTDEFPTLPNVEMMIGSQDCQGSTLAAISAPTPAYPAGPYSHGRQGWVVVRFNVDPDGAVDDVRVARAVPDGPFNRVSLRAVRTWQFRPLDGADRLENCVVMFEFRAGEVQIR